MRFRPIVLVLLVVLLVVPFASVGCAAIPIAALGSALGLGATAVSTGASVYSLGKLNSAEPATGDATRHAVEATGDTLGLHTVDGGFVPNTDTYVFHWIDDFNAKVEVTVAPRAARLTRLQVNVGLLGNEPTAQLILLKIREQLSSNAKRDADRLGDPLKR